MKAILRENLEIIDADSSDALKAAQANVCTSVASSLCFASGFDEQSVGALEETAACVSDWLVPVLGHTPSVVEVSVEALRNERDRRIRDWPDNTYHRYVHPLRLRMQASLLIARYGKTAD